MVVTTLAIYGAGAVGCYCGGALARAGIDVRFITQRRPT